MMELPRPLAAPRPAMRSLPSSAKSRPRIGQIDRLVYELYGLTEEEIGIVEAQVTTEHY